MHKITKPLTHLWISIVSLSAFGFGWAFLAHSEKPAPLAITQSQTSAYSLPALEPIPSLDEYLQNNAQPVQLLRSQSSSATVNFPRLRTRGS